MGFLTHGIFNTWLGHAQIGHGIFNTWFCTAWPASCRALFAAFCNISTKGGRRSRPPFVYILSDAANNALHAADHAAGHAAGHAVQNHVLKIMYPDLGMPKPCS